MDSKVRKPSLTIGSETEFQSLMEDIDSEMVACKVPITARPFKAGMIISDRYDIQLNAVPLRREPIPGDYSSGELSIRIQQWVDQRYGAKTALDLRIGTVALPLRGDLYVINCLKTWGNVKFIFSPTTIGEKRPSVEIDQPPTCNIVDIIDGCTPDLAKSLNAEEVLKCVIAFYNGMVAYTAMDAINDQPYIKPALADCEAAVGHLFTPHTNYGLSKWASLQAVEKLIKSYLTVKGQAFEKIHVLDTLYNVAQAAGLPKPPIKFINDIQCSPGVRYGEIIVNVDEAVLSHLVSLELCEVAARHIGAVIGRAIPTMKEPTVDGMPLSAFLRKYSNIK